MVIAEKQNRSNLLIRSLTSPKWELDLYLYFILVALVLIPAALTERSVVKSITEFIHWILIKFIQFAIAYVIFLLISNYLIRNGKKYLYLYQMSIIGFIGGSSTSIFVYLVLNYTNFVQSDRSYLSYFFGTGLMGAIWLPVCCAASVAFRKFTKMNDLLNSKLTTQIIDEIHNSEMFKSAVENEDRITTKQVIKIIDNMSHGNFKKNDLGSIGFKRGFKRGLKRGLKRGFTHRTKVANISNIYSLFISTANVYRYSIRNKPLNPNYFTFMLTVIIGLSVIRNNHSYYALIIISYFAIYTYFFHTLQIYVYKRIKNWFWLVNLCDFLNIFALISTGYLLARFNESSIYPKTPILQTSIVIVALYFLLYFTGHISQSASIRYNEHKQNLEKYLNSDRFKLKILNQELEKDAMKWEQIVHGKLQSKILANLVMEKRESDLKKLRDGRLIDDVMELISDTLSPSASVTGNLGQIVEKVVEPWRSVIEIESQFDSKIAKQELSPAVSQRVFDVLEEAITNAVKHGGAEEVWIDIKSQLTNSLKLQVKNNGKPVGKSDRKSLGTNLFNQSGIWSLSNEGGLVIFNIQIDI